MNSRFLKVAAAGLLFGLGGLISAPAALAADEGCVTRTYLAGLTASTKESLGIAPMSCVPRSVGETDVEAVVRYAGTSAHLQAGLLMAPGVGSGVALGAAATAVKTLAIGARTWPSLAGSAVAFGSVSVLGLKGALPWNVTPPAEGTGGMPYVPGHWVQGAGVGVTWTASGTATAPTFGGGAWSTTITGVTRTASADPTGTYGAFATGSGGLYWTNPSWTGSAAEFAALWDSNAAGTCGGFTCFGHNFAASQGSMTAAFNTGTKVLSFSPVASALKMQTTEINGNATGSGWEPRFYRGTFGTGTNKNFVVDLQASIADPSTTRTVEQTVTCKDIAGALTTTTASTAYTPAFNVSIAGLDCSAGKVAIDHTADLRQANAAGTTNTPLLAPCSGGNCLTDAAKKTPLGAHVAANPTLPWPYVPTDLDIECKLSTACAPDEVVVTPSSDPPTVDSSSPGALTGSDFCGWSLGSVLDGSIVYKAVSCALSWAFVPEEGFMAEQMTATSTAWDDSAAGTFTQAALDVPAGLTGWFSGTHDSCAGPTIHLAWAGVTQDLKPFDACTEPIAGVAAKIKLIMTVLLVVAGAIVIANPILRGLGLTEINSPGTSDEGGK